MLKYIVYRSPYEVPRVTTKEFADQINEDQIIANVDTLEDAICEVIAWYDEACVAYCGMSAANFAALMGLSDVDH